MFRTCCPETSPRRLGGCCRSLDTSEKVVKQVEPGRESRHPSVFSALFVRKRPEHLGHRREPARQPLEAGNLPGIFVRSVLSGTFPTTCFQTFVELLEIRPVAGRQHHDACTALAPCLIFFWSSGRPRTNDPRYAMRCVSASRKAVICADKERGEAETNWAE